MNPFLVRFSFRGTGSICEISFSKCRQYDFGVFRHAIFSNLRGDIYGGLTAAVVALPLALAFGVASGLGPLAGLYGAILVGFFAAVFGGTPSQISGPTGPITVVMAIVITQFAHNPALAFTVVMMGGAFQILFGMLKLGRFIKLVPYPVISGFMSGVGCIIMILQLAPLLGHDTPAGTMIVKLAALPAILGSPDIAALLLGGMVLLIMFITPKRITVIVPSSLIGLILGIAASYLYFTDVPLIGEIPTGVPDLQLPAFTLHDFPVMLRSALILAFLGSIDSLMTSLVADNITGTRHNSDRELIGQGIGNCLAGVFGAIPGAGATMRTVINVRAGGRTKLSGALHSVVLLAIVLGVADIAEHIPLAVLAGILFKVGIDIIDWRYIKRAFHAPAAGVFIMFITLVLTVVTDLVTAVAVGIVMASLLFVKRMADAQSQSMKLISGSRDGAQLNDDEAAILDKAAGRIGLFHLTGPLSFGSARDVAALLASKNQQVLILDLSDVPFIDSSASIALEEIIEDAGCDRERVVMCGLRENVLTTLKKMHVLDLLPAEYILPSRREALRFAETLLR